MANAESGGGQDKVMIAVDRLIVHRGVRTKSNSVLLSKMSARSTEIHVTRTFRASLIYSIGFLKLAME